MKSAPFFGGASKARLALDLPSGWTPRALIATNRIIMTLTAGSSPPWVQSSFEPALAKSRRIFQPA